jgi:hypothetical protein
MVSSWAPNFGGPVYLGRDAIGNSIHALPTAIAKAGGSQSYYNQQYNYSLGMSAFDMIENSWLADRGNSGYFPVVNGGLDLANSALYSWSAEVNQNSIVAHKTGMDPSYGTLGVISNLMSALKFLKEGYKQEVYNMEGSFNLRSTIEGYNYKKAIETLNNNASASSQGVCAKYARLALEGGGLNTNGRPNSAKDYNTFLPTLGFKEVGVANYVPIAGDIVVMQNSGTHVHLHIQMYNGEAWVSDFFQSGFWPYSTNRPTYQIFR